MKTYFVSLQLFFFVILLCIICLYTSLHLWVLIGGVILVDKYINYIIPWYEPFITCLYSAYKCKIGGLKEVLPLIRLKTPPSKHLCSSFSLLRFISVSWEKCEGGPVFFNPQPPPQKGNVSGVTCFLSLPLLPQYWRACPSQPALLNAAHGSSVKPTSATTPTASPSPPNAKVVQVSLVRLLTPTVHAAWSLSPTQTHTPPLQLLCTNLGRHWLFVYYFRRLLSAVWW